MIAAINGLELRTYDRQNCITFRKTAEKFGGLSNMAGGYPLFVNGIRILTSEALYQACRFPRMPDVQRLIIAERSPMTAKMRSKPYRDGSRVDWDSVRTKIMRWCLNVKLIQNWEKFSSLLLETENKPIVEDSRKDDFWGAKPVDEETLIGINVLGRLLMQLREDVKSGVITSKTIIQPLPIPDFLLYEREIDLVSADGEFYLDSNPEVLVEVDKEVDSQSTVEAVLSIENKCDLVDHKKNGINSQSKNSKAFDILLPHIENLLNSEHTDKELAESLEVPLTLMRKWLDKAVKLGRVKKLHKHKPVTYVLECQLSFLDQVYN
jgi:ribA/ribD-fused uncharacterized protein